MLIIKVVCEIDVKVAPKTRHTHKEGSCQGSFEEKTRCFKTCLRVHNSSYPPCATQNKYGKDRCSGGVVTDAGGVGGKRGDLVISNEGG